MSGSEQPWWASDGSGVDPDEDPLTAHRSARAGEDVPHEGPAGSHGHDDHVGGHGHEDAGHEHAGHDRPAGGAPWGELAEAFIRLARDAAQHVNARSRTHSAPAAERRPHGPPHDDHHVDACQVCPVCAGLRVLGDVRPELVTHLSEAARHVTLAARAFVDAQADAYGGADDLERIDLDDEV